MSPVVEQEKVQAYKGNNGHQTRLIVVLSEVLHFPRAKTKVAVTRTVHKNEGLVLLQVKQRRDAGFAFQGLDGIKKYNVSLLISADLILITEVTTISSLKLTRLVSQFSLVHY